MNKKTNLSVIAYEKARNNQHQGGYKYLIRSNWGAYTAYKTDAGFKFFLESRNLKLTKTNEMYDDELGKISTYDVIGEVVERSFWDISEIPEGAKPFTGLSNGSLVECYYYHVEGGSIIFRPNPNAHGVYQPMPIDEHIEFQKVYG